ncbi:hypothetical protein GUITHDRAFT_111701 [Guillardia theta CCMP2712]|uniref:C2H2-type domain-containing protein n=1 Tax=Guillardia theta (strain CCMP2712) TaxID=905079 RepID=L1J1M1_GUITC|nr:hypothetical protein GUITHDRAFT_111701 [Guillardia theta CCMP2712]EKX42423.1 hypothetical protein GUITHDRAFT_111701 [Guillardia theta CCMP2712]|eukprot:XP_005829403.1 hypothetical protein GUITHDRAFT_111701 [Guillardia theta CCMP2712]
MTWLHPPTHRVIAKPTRQPTKRVIAFTSRRKDRLEEYMPSKPVWENAEWDRYYAPRGIGHAVCKVCDRNFINEEILQQHFLSDFHQDKLELSLKALHGSPAQQESTAEEPESETSLRSMTIFQLEIELRKRGVLADSQGHGKGWRYWTERLRLLEEEGERREEEEGGSKTTREVKESIRSYLRTCLSMGTAPCSAFLEHPEDGSLRVRGRIHPSAKSVRSIAAAIASCCWLVDLDLGDNDLRAKGTILLCSAIMESRNAIRKLVLDGNNIGDVMIEYKEDLSFMEDVIIPAQLSRPFKMLQPWPAPSAKFTDTSAASSICRLLLPSSSPTSSSLLSLSLANNSLGDASLACIADAVAAGQQLRSLNLAGNAGKQLPSSPMTASARALAAMLSISSALVELDLSWNGYRGEAAGLLVEGIARNSSLQALLLGWNSVGSVGGEELEKALRCPTLTSVDISYNCMEEEQAAAVARAVASSSSLRLVTWKGNNFSPHLLADADEKLKERRSHREKQEEAMSANEDRPEQEEGVEEGGAVPPDE